MNDCNLIIEASSSRTSVHLSIDGEISNFEFGINKGSSFKIDKHKISNHVVGNDFTKYYSNIFSDEYLDFLVGKKCNNVNAHLLATGGMRVDISDDLQTVFYSKLLSKYRERSFCNKDKKCINIALKTAKTISSEEEGKFLHKSLKHHFGEENDFIAIDIGGKTLQISSNSEVIPFNLGANHAIELIGYDRSDVCFNEKLQYNGEQCRKLIREEIFAKYNIPDLKNTNVIGTATLINIFNDICSTYIRYFNKDPNVKNLCKSHLSNDSSFEITVGDYKKITDISCVNWQDNWDLSKLKYEYARKVCFYGNYIYEFLISGNLDELDIIQLHSSNWAYGAMQHYISADHFD